MPGVQNPICISRSEFGAAASWVLSSYPCLVVSVLGVVALDRSAGQ